MKILSIDDMLEVAASAQLESYDKHVEALEAAATALAEALAVHFDINTNGATWEGKAFAGLCASFWTADKREGPEEIGEMDTGGDWY